MYRDTRPDPAANLQSVLRGLTDDQKDYLRRPAPQPGAAPQQVTDAEALAELAVLNGIAQRAAAELRQDRLLNEDSLPDTLLQHLLALSREIRRVTEGHEMLAPQAARAALRNWARGDGKEHALAFHDLRTRLAAVLATQDADALAAQQPRVRTAPPPPAPRSNAEILRDELAETIGRKAPNGEHATVKAILVIGGRAYRGRNDGSRVSQVTYDLVTRRLDRLEKWTPTGCAEVHALDAFVVDRNFATEALALAALTGAPPAYPDGWIAAMDARGRTPDARSWEKRLPCDNCRQWLAALGIQADTRGALS
ncbi:hypothetical protein ACIRBX_01200 [Kitasatospora sp. NPDC096147]|uniref:hypothetical protein n=1 Tax=Kitasatospora sp. NPDC096147 TaxID=3364093 RepID=UPI0037F5DC53